MADVDEDQHEPVEQQEDERREEKKREYKIDPDKMTQIEEVL